MHNYVGHAVATGDPVVSNSLFIGNSANAGGGMRNNDPHPVITNCTFAGNTGGAISNRNGSIPTVVNSILWENPGGSINGSSTVSFSNVQGGHAGTGNLDADPLFLDVANGNYRLAPGSPLLDAGDNAAPHLPAMDLVGNSRISNGLVDIGVYEDVSCDSSATCDDTDPCTEDVCSGGMCASEPLVCPPGWTCVAGSCDPVFCDTDPAGEVANLNWSPDSATNLEWSAMSGATSYTLYQGDEANLPNLLDSAMDSCTELVTGATTAAGLTDIPALGEFIRYLVVPDNSCGVGGAGNATAGPRQLNSTGVCTP